MNFLAHSLYGFDNPALTAGQFCGDFVRGSDLSWFPAEVECGIRLHRHLDRFTDTHAALVPARQNIPGVPRRFAGIVVDVMFDHYVALSWDDISDLSLDEHASNVNDALKLYEAWLPENLKRFRQLLERERILQNNTSLASIELTLSRIARRSSRLSPIALSKRQLKPLRESLQGPFEQFLPDLNSSAVSYLNPWPSLDKNYE